MKPDWINWIEPHKGGSRQTFFAHYVEGQFAMCGRRAGTARGVIEGAIQCPICQRARLSVDMNAAQARQTIELNEVRMLSREINKSLEIARARWGNMHFAGEPNPAESVMLEKIAQVIERLPVLIEGAERIAYLRGKGDGIGLQMALGRLNAMPTTEDEAAMDQQ